MSEFKQAERHPGDGPMYVGKEGGEHVRIECTTDGKPQTMLLSAFNAARVFGGLALALGIPLPSSIGEAIKY